MKRRLVVVLLASVVAAVGLSLAPPASAGGVRVRVHVVDNDTDRGKCRVGHRHRAPLATIQAAVDAAGPHDIIVVCPGRYEETVTVGEADHHLTILGAKAGRDARKRDRRHESIVTADAVHGVVQLLADHVTWDGFTIVDNTAGPGLRTSPTSAGNRVRNTIFQDNGIGVQLGSDGEHTTTVQHNLFIKNNEFTGAGAGSGVYSNESASDVVITDNRFEGHNLAGILFADHRPNSPVVQQEVLVARNKSIDDLSFATFYDSTRVCVTGNLVKARVGDPQFPGPASGIFIGARNNDVVVQVNRITAASGSGITVSDTPGRGVPEAGAPRNVRILKNKVSGAHENGIDLFAGTAGQYEVRGNKALDNKKVGLLVDRTVGARLQRNTALDNEVRDCQDVGGLPLKNTWTDNTGVTAGPRVICAPFGDDGRQHHDKPKHRHKHKQQHHEKQHKRQGHGNRGFWSPCLPCRF